MYYTQESKYTFILIADNFLNCCRRLSISIQMKILKKIEKKLRNFFFKVRHLKGHCTRRLRKFKYIYSIVQEFWQNILKKNYDIIKNKNSASVIKKNVRYWVTLYNEKFIIFNYLYTKQHNLQILKTSGIIQFSKVLFRAKLHYWIHEICLLIVNSVAEV